MRLRCAAVILGLLVLPSTFSGAQSRDIASVVEELTLQEKACPITGMNKWETCAVPRSGIPAVWMADGPVVCAKTLARL